jgi:hypothetical protein
VLGLQDLRAQALVTAGRKGLAGDSGDEVFVGWVPDPPPAFCVRVANKGLAAHQKRKSGK